MIFNMSGGYGSGGTSTTFIIEHGETRPTKPSDNTVWVNTNIPVTKYYFQAEQPANMKQGELWITIGDSGNVKVTTPLGKEWVTVYFLNVQQYVNGALVDKTAKIYQNGEWVDWWNGELFDNGNQFESVTGGWEQKSGLCSYDRPNTGTVSVGNTLSTRSISAATINSGILTTKNAIDLTGFSYLHIVIDTIIPTPWVAIHSFAAGDIKNSESLHACDHAGQFDIDISGLSGSGKYYVSVGGNSNGGIDVSQVKLQR